LKIDNFFSSGRRIIDLVYAGKKLEFDRIKPALIGVLALYDSHCRFLKTLANPLLFLPLLTLAFICLNSLMYPVSSEIINAGLFWQDKTKQQELT
jgi:hypothetical protein